VLGDVCIFLTPARLHELLDRAVGSLPPGGHLVAAHGHGFSPDIFMSGDPGPCTHPSPSRAPQARRISRPRLPARHLGTTLSRA
jgi:hypothetical protein